MTYHVQFPGLGLEFTLDRVAFTVFGMPIYWYGILIATGLALAIVFAFSHARRFGIDSDRMVDVILIGTVCAVIGGRHLQLPLKRAGNAGRAGRCGGPVPAGAPYVFV